MLVCAIRAGLTPAGIKFSDGVVKDDEICRIVVGKTKAHGRFKMYPDYSIINPDLKC